MLLPLQVLLPKTKKLKATPEIKRVSRCIDGTAAVGSAGERDHISAQIRSVSRASLMVVLSARQTKENLNRLNAKSIKRLIANAVVGSAG